MTRPQAARLIGMVGVPVLIGLSMGIRWEKAGESFYATISQVIATLFIAIAVEFFSSEAASKELIDRIVVLSLIALSWAGLFASIRGLLDGGTRLTVALSGAGVIAASLLVSLALYARIRARSEGSETSNTMAVVVVLLFLWAPVLLLGIL